MEHNKNSYAKRTRILENIFLGLLILLMSIVNVNAAVDVYLQSPADQYNALTNLVDFYCYANTTGAISNLSFYTNTTGPWNANKTLDLVYMNISSNPFATPYWTNATGTSGGTLGTVTYNLGSGVVLTGNPAFGFSSSSWADLIYNVNTTYGTYKTSANSFGPSSDANAFNTYLFLMQNPSLWIALQINPWTSEYRFITSAGGTTVNFPAPVPTLAWLKFNVYSNNTCEAFYSIQGDYNYTKYHTWVCSPISYKPLVRVQGDKASTFNFALSANIYNFLYYPTEMNTENFGTSNLKTTGHFNQTLNVFTYPSVYWSCQACDTGNTCSFANENRTVILNPSAPSIAVHYPSGNISYAYRGQSVNLNYTVIDTNLDTCWYDYMGINTTVNCLTNTNIILNTSENLIFYANDTAMNLGTLNHSWNYNIFKNYEVYNTTTYESSYENYILNISSDGQETVIASLVYDGVVYPSTKTGNNYNMIFTNSLNIPLQAGINNKTFYWNVSYGSTVVSTQQYNQTVDTIHFIICNATYNVPYINFTYRDEMDLTYINASITSINWNYWAGTDTSIYRSYFYSNTTEYPSHAFCFSPPFRGITALYNYKVSSLGYVTRTFSTTLPLTNTTTNKLLYMIKTADSGPVTFIASDATSGNPLSNVYITISRDIGGSIITIAEGYTDDSGALAVWLSSIVTYTVTASRSDCGILTRTITPVGSINIQLNCLSNIIKFVSSIDGVTYQRTPKDGITIPGNNVFSYFVSSIRFPIVSVMFQLIDGDGNTIATNSTDVSSGYPWCNATSCLLTIDHTGYSGDNVKGRYYINLGNATNYTSVLLEGDAYWRYITINQNNSQQAGLRFANNLRNFFNDWGNNNINCIVYQTNTTCTSHSECKWVYGTEWDAIPPDYSKENSYCVLRDDLNKQEFNRIVIIFFGLVILLFIMAKSTGYEMTNPGSFVMWLTGIIFIMSYLQFFEFSGLTPWAFLNRWLYFFICLEFSIGYNLSIIRRYSA